MPLWRWPAALLRLTPKQEAFARVYVAAGNASEAYRRAYDTHGSPESIAREAHALINHPKVASRIEELREQIVAYANVTPERIAAELEEVRNLGRKWKQGSTMIGAIERKADLKDLFGKRRLQVNKRVRVEHFRSMATDELAAYVEAGYRELGDGSGGEVRQDVPASETGE